MAGWIKLPLGMEVGLGHIVLDGDSARLLKGHSPQIFGPCLLWPNFWIAEDATWCGVGLGADDVVLDGDPALPIRGTQPLTCGDIIQVW